MATYNELATNYANQKKQEYEQSLGYLTEGLNKQQALDKTALQQRYDNLINQIKKEDIYIAIIVIYLIIFLQKNYWQK